MLLSRRVPAAAAAAASAAAAAASAAATKVCGAAAPAVTATSAATAAEVAAASAAARDAAAAASAVAAGALAGAGVGVGLGLTAAAGSSKSLLQQISQRRCRPSAAALLLPPPSSPPLCAPSSLPPLHASAPSSPLSTASSPPSSSSMSLRGELGPSSSISSASAAPAAGTSAAASVQQQMSAAVILERLPIVMPKPPTWMLEYEAFSFGRRQGYRKSYPSEFVEGAGITASSSSDDEDNMQFGRRDDDDAAAAESEESQDPMVQEVLRLFNDPSRTTAADRSNDVRSLQRRLDKRLFLLVKSTQDGQWTFPQAQFEGSSTDGDGDVTMRKCAERAAKAVVPPPQQQKLYFIGNAPCAHLEFQQGGEADPPERAERDGKRFYFRAYYMNTVGEEHASLEAADAVWVTKDEVPEYIKDPEEKALMSLLLQE